MGRARLHLGARNLQAGTGGISDETGFVAGIGYSFDVPLDLYAEVASFEGLAAPVTMPPMRR
jgi:hypothetical protein